MDVVLVSRDGLFADALELLLGELAPQAAVRRAPDLDAASGAQPGALVVATLDALGPEPSQALSRASARTLPVVVIGESSDTALMDELLDAGAVAYVPASYSTAAIRAALQLALSGSPSRPTDFAGTAPAATESGARPVPDALRAQGITPREAEVLALAGEGKSNEQIAHALGMAPGTVRIHMSAILKKLNARNRTEATRIAERLAAVRDVRLRHAEQDAFELEWLLPHMTHRRLAAGHVLFRRGEPGHELFYLQRGDIALEEIEVRMKPGDIFGEIGIFAPDHTRTCTAVCATPADVFWLSADQVKQIYLVNPRFAMFIVHLIARRLMADRDRTVPAAPVGP